MLGKTLTATDVVQKMDKSRSRALLKILESGQGVHYMERTWFLIDGDLATAVYFKDPEDGIWTHKYVFPGVTFSFFIRMAQEIDDQQIVEGLNGVALKEMNSKYRRDKNE